MMRQSSTSSSPLGLGVPSCIEMLPDDVLSEVFLHCPYDDSTFHPLITPWTLVRVSRRWRAVALATSPLWSTVSVDMDSLSYSCTRDTQYKRYKKLLLLSLERSKKSPLYVHYKSAHDWSDEAEAGYKSSFFEILLRHRQRCRTLRVAVRSMNDSWNFSHLAYEFPSLEEVGIDIDDSYLESDFYEEESEPETQIPDPHRTLLDVLSSLGNPPRLKRLELSRLPAPLPQIAWGQLSEFRTSDQDAMTTVLEILKVATELTALHVSDAFYYENISLPSTQFVHDRLRALHIKCSSFPRSVLFDCLTLPSLETLDIEVFHEFTLDDTKQIVSFLRRSSPLLRWLSLKTENISKQADLDHSIGYPLPLVLPQLCTLRLLGEFGYIFLGHIAAPVLHDLELCCPRSCMETNLIIDALQRSSCAIHSLVIGGTARVTDGTTSQDVFPMSSFTSPIAISSLRTLRVPLERHVSYLLDGLIFPALNILELRGIERRQDMEHAISMIERSSPPLKTLSIKFSFIIDGAIERVLLGTPQLEDLILNGPLTEQLIVRLSCSGSKVSVEGSTIPRSLVPSLNCLGINSPRLFHEESLFDMLRSRTKASSEGHDNASSGPLCHIDLDIDPNLQLPQLKSLLPTNTRVKITSFNRNIIGTWPDDIVQASKLDDVLKNTICNHTQGVVANANEDIPAMNYLFHCAERLSFATVHAQREPKGSRFQSRQDPRSEQVLRIAKTMQRIAELSSDQMPFSQEFSDSLKERAALLAQKWRGIARN